MATLTVYPDANPETTTVDGFVFRSSAISTWSGIRDGVGTGFDDTTLQNYVIYIQSDFLADTYRKIIRGIFLFNTSSIGAGSTITAAVLSLYGIAKTDPAGWTPNIDIYTSNPASNTALAAADYTTLGTTSQTGSPITYANFTNSVYNDFTFNATGISNISKTSISKFGVRNANYDAANTPPTYIASEISSISVSYAEDTGTTRDPKLVVTYSSGWTHNYLGVANANISTIDGISKSNISKVSGA